MKGRGENVGAAMYSRGRGAMGVWSLGKWLILRWACLIIQAKQATKLLRNRKTCKCRLVNDIASDIDLLGEGQANESKRPNSDQKVSKVVNRVGEKTQKIVANLSFPQIYFSMPRTAKFLGSGPWTPFSHFLTVDLLTPSLCARVR